MIKFNIQQLRQFEFLAFAQIQEEQKIVFEAQISLAQPFAQTSTQFTAEEQPHKPLGLEFAMKYYLYKI